eukprot:1212520-Alexandrium_andersonii.AAC.1
MVAPSAQGGMLCPRRRRQPRRQPWHCLRVCSAPRAPLGRHEAGCALDRPLCGKPRAGAEPACI